MGQSPVVPRAKKHPVILLALVKISLTDLQSFVKVKPSELEDRLSNLGIPLEKMDGDELSVEITPNRPDWLSVEGIARSLLDFSTGKPKKYSAARSTIKWVVDRSVKDVRPCLGSGIVRNVPVSGELVASVMQLQEKLHDTLGRNRRKLAIGLHDFSAVQPPFTYLAVGREELRFVPLDKRTPMTPGQILTEHEKGIAFAHLVGEKCPMIVDINGAVLSFPPIINGERTRVTSSTRDILVDCTGTSESAVKVAVQIIAAALVDRGGTAEEVLIDGKVYPLFEPLELNLPLDGARRLLGIPLSAQDAARHLRRMGHEVKNSKALAPSWRADILHAVDLIEDIAISYGYNNFEPSLPQFTSVGKVDESLDAAHSAMLGLGYFEAQSWHLTNEKLLSAAKLSPASPLKVENPLTEEFTTLRPALYPNIIDVLAHSRTEPLPHYVYEIGPVFENNSEKMDLCGASCHAKAGWAELKSHIDAFGKSLSLSFEFRPAKKDGFIEGRCAELLHNGQVVGFAGEVHPEVLEAFSIEQPVALFEINAEILRKK